MSQLKLRLLFIASFLFCKTAALSRIIFPDDDRYIPNGSNYNNRYDNDQQSSDDVRTRKGNLDLFPRPGVCGPIKPNNNIYGGTEVELEDFGWLANLEYKKDDSNVIVVGCAGNIINRRYILTAAHCVTGSVLASLGRLISVRVGDHNIDTPNDCNENNFCIDPPQYFGIEKIIVHEKYGRYMQKRSTNDIALLRVDRNIMYSSSVTPICLATVADTIPPLEAGAKLIAVGWGHTGNASYSPVKLMVEEPYVENKDCPLAVSMESHLCSGGVIREGSCTGDSGGGLYRTIGSAWFIEGIVSYGRGCGLEVASVNTRVSSYLDWIEKNVFP
uniref:Peptidase S1 domain-containing protein n=1 Tax=Stomoxys calcitrans TaxID=35570 RepID=A0A1I8Q2B4_STOCA